MPEHPQSYFLNPISGAPATAVNEIQSAVIGGTPTGGTFKLRKDGVATAAIPWSAVNATLLASINAACDAAFSTGALVASAGGSPALTAGIGQVLLTAGGKLAGLNISQVAAESSLTGTTPTITMSTTTQGVDATHRDAPRSRVGEVGQRQCLPQ